MTIAPWPWRASARLQARAVGIELLKVVLGFELLIAARIDDVPHRSLVPLGESGLGARRL